MVGRFASSYSMPSVRVRIAAFHPDCGVRFSREASAVGELLVWVVSRKRGVSAILLGADGLQLSGAGSCRCLALLSGVAGGLLVALSADSPSEVKLCDDE